MLQNKSSYKLLIFVLGRVEMKFEIWSAYEFIHLFIHSFITIHLVLTRDFLKNQHFLAPDKQTYACVYISFPENFAHELNDDPFETFINSIIIFGQ